MTCILTLVRHGETPANVEGVWHGSTDTPLTETGHDQARRAASHVASLLPRADALYASPLQRAHLTAEAIGERLALGVEPVPDLAEYDLGAWEGRAYEDLIRSERIFERMAREPDWQPGGGESPRGVAERIVGALEQLAARHDQGRIVVVSHGGAMTLGLGWLLDREPGRWRRVMDNCAVSELRLDPAPELLSWNVTVHLEDAA